MPVPPCNTSDTSISLIDVERKDTECTYSRVGSFEDEVLTSRCVRARRHGDERLMDKYISELHSRSSRRNECPHQGIHIVIPTERDTEPDKEHFTRASALYKAMPVYLSFFLFLSSKCPPSVTASEFDHHHHHHHPAGGASPGGPPCCQSRRSSGLYTSTPLLLSTSSPGPVPASSSSILEGSALYRPPNTARALLRQPLLGEGMRGEEDQGAGRGASSSSFSRSSRRPVSWYTACFRPYWCQRLCGGGGFFSSSPPLREDAHTSSSSPPARGDTEGNSPNSRRRGTAGGRCRRLATCLFPWSKRRSARRLIHPSTSPQAGNLVGAGAGGATVRVEPKTFFANERTLLQWMNTAVLIATLSITLMNFGDPIGRLAGLVMAPVAVFFIGYSFWVS